MMTHKKNLLIVFYLLIEQLLNTQPLIEQLQKEGYIEFYNSEYGSQTFNTLYENFDQLINFLQNNKIWKNKFFIAKERFIRSKYRNFYATDFVGFYDESENKKRSQISFYYSTHFHKFLCSLYPEINAIPEIVNFLQICFEIQSPCSQIFKQIADELPDKTIFDANDGNPAILFKIVKYLPAYHATKPHYDGTAFSLFLDSTDNQSLLLCPYQSCFQSEDFFTPPRQFCRSCDQNSNLLIAGTCLNEFGLYPTPHIVLSSGTIRYATIAFAMRPNYIQPKNNFSDLPMFPS